LIDKDVLSAISPAVVGASPSVLNPQAFWNVEVFRIKQELALGAPK
jgi:hypothetical protein